MHDPGGFLGGSSTMKPYSEQTAQMIDREIRKTIETCYGETRQLLTDNNKFLHTLAEALLINETIDAEEMSIVYHCYMSDKKIEDSLKSRTEATKQA